MLTRYARERNFPNVSVYSDDGWSGTNFERPDWKRLISDIEAGKVGIVLVKDLSRVGRDYLRVGFYTEVTFPQNGVRFIAVNNGVDSANQSENDFAPFLNIMNDFYARDTSKKVSAVYRAKGNKGEHTGNHPIYGYLKDPENKRRWIIDEEAAAVVRRIFCMVIDGKGVYQIADILSEEKVLCPSAYLAAKGVGNRRNNKFEDSYRWWGTTVSYILARVEYMGIPSISRPSRPATGTSTASRLPKRTGKSLRTPMKPSLTRLHGKPRRSSAGRSGAVTAIKSRTH